MAWCDHCEEVVCTICDENGFVSCPGCGKILDQITVPLKKDASDEESEVDNDIGKSRDQIRGSPEKGCRTGQKGKKPPKKNYDSPQKNEDGPESLGNCRS